MDAAIIMPVYGQGPLICESVNSALAQKTRYDYRIILVDDNCPQRETVDNCRRYARLYPDKVLYWRSPVNRGLAAMRNEGVQLALELWPDIFAVTSFDGDDRLHPLFLERGVSALKAAQEETIEGARYGWVFEDPDHFGIDGVMLRTHGYSSLFSMAGCSNTPTSPMLADIFRSGVRFREQMKSGSEDWQFWLHALKKGFRGKYVPKIGFRYRRRSGSMAFYALKQADRNRAEIRLTHPEIYHPDFFLAEEAAESPRYAHVSTHAGESAGLPRVGDVESLVAQLCEYEWTPTTPIPQYLVFAAPETLRALKRNGLLAYALWRQEMMAGPDKMANARLHPPKTAETAVEISSDASSSTGTLWAEMICISSKLMLELMRNATSLDRLKNNKSVRQTNYWLHNVPSTPITDEFSAFLEQAKVLYKRRRINYYRQNLTKWEPFGIERYAMAKHFFDAAPLLARPDAKHETLLIIREEDLAKPELKRVVVTLSAKLRAQGLGCALLVLGSKVEQSVARAFDQLFVLRPTPATRGDAAVEAGDDALVGLIAPFGAVVAVGCARIAPSLNQLRRYGRNVLGVLPERATGETELHRDLVHCFKIFKGLYCVSELEAARAEALGVAPEQIVTTEEGLLARVVGQEAIPE